MSLGVWIIALVPLLPAVIWLGLIANRRRRYPIREFPGFLSDAECDHLIERARPQMKRSTTNLRGRTGTHEEGRTSSTAFLDQSGDTVVQDIKRRIADLSDTLLENQERIQVTHYGEGQRFDFHYDSFRHGQTDPGEAGDRICTVILYLNDDFNGGATHFPRVRRRIRAERGKAVLFRNLSPGTHYIDTFSKHRGEPITNGEKWLSNQWIREKRATRSTPRRSGSTRGKRAKPHGRR